MWASVPSSAPWEVLRRAVSAWSGFCQGGELWVSGVKRKVQVSHHRVALIWHWGQFLFCWWVTEGRKLNSSWQWPSKPEDKRDRSSVKSHGSPCSLLLWYPTRNYTAKGCHGFFFFLFFFQAPATEAVALSYFFLHVSHNALKAVMVQLLSAPLSLCEFSFKATCCLWWH